MATGAAARLEEELRDYTEQIANIVEDANELTAPLTDAQFNWRPAAGAWSISECIAHLNAVDGLDLPSLTSNIELARKNGVFGHGPFRYGMLSRWFVALMEPPVGRIKVKAPPVYVPPPDRTKEETMAEFESIHARLSELIRSANGLDLARVKVPTPMGKRVKFSLGQRFALITAHDRRHLWQAWQVRKNSGFPSY